MRLCRDITSRRSGAGGEDVTAMPGKKERIALEQRAFLQETGWKGWKYGRQVALFFVIVAIGLGWFWWSDSGDWVVKADGTKITLREWQEESERAFRFYREVYGIDLEEGTASGLRRQVEQQVLRKMVDRALLKKAALRAGVAVPDYEVDGYLVEVAKRAGGIAGMRRILREQGLTLDEYRRQVRDMLLIQRLEEMVAQGVEVSEDEIRRAYERDYSRRFSYQDVREALRQQLLAAKRNQVVVRYLEELRERGRVMYNQRLLRNGLT
ncbi:MAG: SurA N-terminal domain-containing protein [Thermacetogeniaceae bacterium]